MITTIQAYFRLALAALAFVAPIERAIAGDAEHSISSLETPKYYAHLTEFSYVKADFAKSGMLQMGSTSSFAFVE